jgi:hypothetical protein
MRALCNYLMVFPPLALQSQFRPWPTSMKLSVSLLFTRSKTFGSAPWAGDQLVARPLYLYTNTEKGANTHTQTLNIHALSEIRTHDPGFRASRLPWPAFDEYKKQFYEEQERRGMQIKYNC